MQKALSIKIFIFVFFFSSVAYIPCLDAQTLAMPDENSQPALRFQQIFLEDSLTPHQQRRLGQAFLFELDEQKYPRIYALSLIKLMHLAAYEQDIQTFEELKKKVSKLSFSPDEDRTLNFLSDIAELKLRKRQQTFVLAINLAKSLQGQLSVLLNPRISNLEEGQIRVSHNDIADLHYLLGRSYYMTANYPSAHKNLLIAMGEYEQSNNLKGRASIYANLSLINWAQQNFEGALDFTEKAIELSQLINDQTNYLNNLLNQGVYYKHLRQFDNALASFNKALNYNSIKQHQDLYSQLLLEKADTLKRIGEYASSQSLVMQAIALSKETENLVNFHIANISLGELLMQQQQYEQALSLFYAAETYFRRSRLVKQESAALKAISDVYRAQGDSEQALQFYQRYSKLNIDMLKRAQSASLLSLSEQYQAQGREKQIKLLRQEKLLDQEKIQRTENQQQFTIAASLGIVVILFLMFSRHYSRKESKKLQEHNAEIEANEKQLMLLSEAFKNTSDAVWIADENQNIVAVNNAYVKHTHRTRNQVLGQKIRFARVKSQDAQLVDRILLQAKLADTWQGELFEQRSNQEVFPIELEIETVKNRFGELTHYLGFFRDITDRKKTEEQLSRLATHDDLTGLPNRALLEQLIHQSCLNSKHNNKLPALLLFEINNFKKINDSLGHKEGDKLIGEVTTRLKSKLLNKDVIAKIGHAEFCVLAELNDPQQSAVRIAQKILSAFDAPFELNNTPINVNASMGITLYPEDGDSAQDLLRKAAVAMLDVKNSESQQYRFFEPNMNSRVTEQLDKEQKVLNAINNEYFDFHYQPIVDTATSSIAGAEALIRWIEPNGEVYSPAEFIPIAEQAGFIEQIDRIVVNKVFQQVAIWQKQNFEFGTVSINLSGKMFLARDELITLLQAKLSQYKVSPKYIKLEITEGMLLHDIQQAIYTMNEIKSLGFQLSLDDFGTGFSSLNYLKQFPIDFLKIDRSFISELHTNDIDQNIVRAIINMAHSLDLKVIAEGVELKEHLNILNSMDCHHYQGYYYSKPLAVSEFELLVKSNINDTAKETITAVSTNPP